MAFLTEFDSRAEAKGSVDPLGIQPIWERLGRYVVGNLTVASDSATDFAVLLLGMHFADKLKKGAESALAVFLRWEQLAAYSRRIINGDGNFRGILRVKKRLQEGTKIHISKDPAHQILSNQRGYGLWGLYRVPAYLSGLLTDDYFSLTAEARDIVDNYLLPLLDKRPGDTDRIEKLLATDTSIDIDKQRQLLQAVAAPLGRKLGAGLRERFADHLLFGKKPDRTGGLQQQLVQLLETWLNDDSFAWNGKVLRELEKQARHHGYEELRFRLERIRIAESLFAPLAKLFSYLLGSDGLEIDSITRTLRKQWGEELSFLDAKAFASLKNDLCVVSAKEGERWVQIAFALTSGSYEELLRLLLLHNADIMKRRGGAPWITEEKLALRVHYFEQSENLPEGEEIQHLWRHSYYLDPIWHMARTLLRN